MKASIVRESFLAAFSQAAQVSPSRSNKEALTYVLLTTGPSGATLVATDLEQAIGIPVPGVEASKPGSVLLPVSTFGSILRESSDETLALALDAKNNLLVTGKASNYKLPTMSVDEFPPFEDETPDKYHEIPCGTLKQAIDRTQFCCDESNSRYALGGVYWELGSKQMIAVGTDGRRLAKAEGFATDSGQGKKEGHIVPARAMRNIARLLDGREGNCRFHLTSNWARFEVDGIIFRARLLEGRFPSWRQVIPTKPEHDIPVATGPLAKAVRQAAIAIRGESRGLDFSFTAGRCDLSATSEGGRADVELPLSYDGSGVAVTLDHRFVGEMLKLFPDETMLSMKLVNSKTGVLFEDGNGYQYVVMPISRER